MRPDAAPSRLARCKTAVLAALCLFGASVTANSRAGESGGLEYAVKAAFLYKLAAFVEWAQFGLSAILQSPSCCASRGTNPFGDQLVQFTAGRRVGSSPIQVRRLGALDRPAGCQILYIGKHRRFGGFPDSPGRPRQNPC